ncbi:DUF3301 domain-containing protein [Neptunicella sp.]|uniref:DUF3301 domain-containing protein n=1 Tax=Neptunicella sp. TaxID=2125986 RepID=UPI003F693CA4
MTFNLFDILLLLFICVIAVQFWRIRAITEKANQYMLQYCDKNNLQLISVSRRKTRLTLHRGKVDWYNEFDFEFSGNGEDSYRGELIMTGLAIKSTDLPAYRI